MFEVCLYHPLGNVPIEFFQGPDALREAQNYCAICNLDDPEPGHLYGIMVRPADPYFKRFYGTISKCDMMVKCISGKPWFWRRPGAEWVLWRPVKEEELQVLGLPLEVRS